MESRLNPKFVERYQNLYDKDKDSKVFAPLAEAYRKLGLIQEAKKICVHGVKIHPDFPSGRMAYAKVLLDLDDLENAANQLRSLIELSPENILAHRLYADVCLKLEMPKEALRSYKMILFLNPSDGAAQNQIQRLESLTADEYSDDMFEMKPIYAAGSELEEPELIRPLESTQKSELAKRQRILERVLSLSDAFIVRNDVDKALQTLEDAENQLGLHPEITKRIQFLKSRSSSDFIPESSSNALPSNQKDKVNKLENWLERIAINSRKSD
ncbi:MAG: tetratricopeptide repeat protein [Bdellovibrionales bacterium]|nr:tetratricopeptide repeat protein [Bdellovibrionales bacterium]